MFKNKNEKDEDKKIQIRNNQINAQIDALELDKASKRALFKEFTRINKQLETRLGNYELLKCSVKFENDKKEKRFFFKNKNKLIKTYILAFCNADPDFYYSLRGNKIDQADYYYSIYLTLLSELKKEKRIQDFAYGLERVSTLEILKKEIVFFLEKIEEKILSGEIKATNAIIDFDTDKQVLLAIANELHKRNMLNKYSTFGFAPAIIYIYYKKLIKNKYIANSHVFSQDYLSEFFKVSHVTIRKKISVLTPVVNQFFNEFFSVGEKIKNINAEGGE